MSSDSTISPTRIAWARGLGVVVALCAFGWFASVGLTIFALKTIDSDMPFFPGIIEVIGLVVTLPPAILCTVIAMILVGPRRAKLAWMSLGLFLLPVLCGIGIGIWESIARDF